MDLGDGAVAGFADHKVCCPHQIWMMKRAANRQESQVSVSLNHLAGARNRESDFGKSGFKLVEKREADARSSHADENQRISGSYGEGVPSF